MSLEFICDRDGGGCGYRDSMDNLPADEHEITWCPECGSTAILENVRTNPEGEGR